MCVLGHGNYPEYMDRCLSSISVHTYRPLCAEVRIGLNACSPATRRLADAAAVHWPKPVRLYAATPQIGKYPMMRRMLYEHPLQTTHVMWFDDDSYIVASGPEFLEKTLGTLSGLDLLGRRISRVLTPQQRQLVTQQVWHKALPLRCGYAAYFPLGGWWLATTELLTRFDWPCRSLVQQDGDWMLGELLRQQQVPWVSHSNGMKISASLDDPEIRAPSRDWAITEGDNDDADSDTAD